MPREPERFPADALPFLRCPICHQALLPAGRSLRCQSGHSYDVARQGYVNLLPGGAHPGTADTAAMVAARDAFLTAGHFEGLRTFLCDMAEQALTSCLGEVASPAGSQTEAGPAGGGPVVEIGAGTGYYLAAMLDRFPGKIGLALDVSKFAARRAARAHERVASVVCDAWSSLPIGDACASLILDVFAPRNPPEFRRMLRGDGALLVVTPSTRHLQELVDRLGLLKVDERKPARLEAAFAAGFTLSAQAVYEESLRLSRAEAGALAAMGPSAHHLRPEQLAQRLTEAGGTISVTLSVVAAVYVPQGREGSGSRGPG
jgi:23S rRNA (guanine745-N1)-methyltransferase